MSATQTQRLVEDYMRRLEVAAANVLPGERATELVEEIHSHVRDALRVSGADDEVSVRNELERIGSPEEIVLAAVDGPLSATRVAATGAPANVGVLEIAAVLMLGVGSVFISALGTVLGLVLVWISPAWSTRDKLIATVLPLALGLALVVPLLWVLAGASRGLSVGGVNLSAVEMLLVFGASGLAGLLSALYLAARLRAATPTERKRRSGLRICLVLAVIGLALPGLIAIELATNSQPTFGGASESQKDPDQRAVRGTLTSFLAAYNGGDAQAACGFLAADVVRRDLVYTSERLGFPKLRAAPSSASCPRQVRAQASVEDFKNFVNSLPLAAAGITAQGRRACVNIPGNPSNFPLRKTAQGWRVVGLKPFAVFGELNGRMPASGKRFTGC